jgi:hypothetical protein
VHHRKTRVADQVKQHGIGRYSSWTGTAASGRTIAASDRQRPSGGAGRDAGAGAQEIPDLLVGGLREVPISGPPSTGSPTAAVTTGTSATSPVTANPPTGTRCTA